VNKNKVLDEENENLIKKIVFCASTTMHIKNFHIPYLKAFHDRGYEVWVIADKCDQIPYADHVVGLSFQKKILSLQNIKAIFSTRKLLKEQNFNIVSTHTTLASIIVRMGVMLIKKKPKVFNTCHGYLFGENDGLKKLIYLIPEKICAYVTNVIMVMNHEDYIIAKKYKLYKDKLYYINAMGIDLSKFVPLTDELRQTIRYTKGFDPKDFLLIYAAEFSKRKNQKLLIKAFASTCKKMPNAKLLLAGNGTYLGDCKTLVKELGVIDQVQFLGYVNDMNNLYNICDASVTTSLIEGLPLNVLEAMAIGLPVIASNIKGHRELLETGTYRYLFEKDNQKELEEKMIEMYKNRDQIRGLGESLKKEVPKFRIEQVLDRIIGIYFS
jgi:glycosyltransferase EpsD